MLLTCRCRIRTQYVRSLIYLVNSARKIQGRAKRSDSSVYRKFQGAEGFHSFGTLFFVWLG